MWRFSVRLALLCAITGFPYYFVKLKWIESCDLVYPAIVSEANVCFLGVSTMRAACSPQHFCETFKDGENAQNYAINGNVTPNGPYLTQWVKSKWSKSDAESRKIFLVEWRKSSFDVNAGNENHYAFRERGHILYKMMCLNLDPNWEYLFRRLQDGNCLIWRNWQTIEQKGYERNGWHPLPRQIDRLNNLEKRLANKQALGREFSQVRAEAFVEMLDHLSQVGEVYLVATPAGFLENSIPQSDEFIVFENQIKGRFGSRFLDYSDWGRFEDYSDADHLIEAAAIRFSRELGAAVESMQSLKTKPKSHPPD